MQNAVTYVARDIERALGMAPSADYFVISNRTAYAETIAHRYPDHVCLIEPAGPPHDPAHKGLLDTHELLAHPQTRGFLEKHSSSILVFKNTPQIEAIAAENGWKLLNPPAAAAEKIENKVSQIDLLGPLAERYLPESRIMPARELAWEKEPFILQWAHGHTGDGTILIDSAAALGAIQDKFSERLARRSAYLRGPSFTVNAAVMPDGTVSIGNMSYQITGLAPFTDNPFSTVGNDWSLTHSLLSDTELASAEEMVRDVGAKLSESGWRGLFGLDLMRDDEKDRLFLIEINARQPASATFESNLQAENRRHGVAGMTVFEAHLAALAGRAVSGTAAGVSAQIIPVNDGAQIVQRITKKSGPKMLPGDIMEKLEDAGYSVIAYPDNAERNADLIRVRSERGIMETHGQLNKRGKEIADILAGE